mmetsp:Transcript_22201/g.56001  ORF Transcript_22201/g.56001 Transcript_22201/m.56001 type:complete len:320 (+) Transcript_22201:275-1234(+)
MRCARLPATDWSNAAWSVTIRAFVSHTRGESSASSSPREHTTDEEISCSLGAGCAGSGLPTAAALGGAPIGACQPAPWSSGGGAARLLVLSTLGALEKLPPLLSRGGGAGGAAGSAVVGASPGTSVYSSTGSSSAGGSVVGCTRPPPACEQSESRAWGAVAAFSDPPSDGARCSCIAGGTGGSRGVVGGMKLPRLRDPENDLLPCCLSAATSAEAGRCCAGLGADAWASSELFRRCTLRGKMAPPCSPSCSPITLGSPFCTPSCLLFFLKPKSFRMKPIAAGINPPNPRGQGGRSAPYAGPEGPQSMQRARPARDFVRR